MAAGEVMDLRSRPLRNRGKGLRELVGALARYAFRISTLAMPRLRADCSVDIWGGLWPGLEPGLFCPPGPLTMGSSAPRGPRQ